MSIIISRRRRTVIQALALTPLLASCYRSVHTTANTIQFGGWAMGSPYFVKLAATHPLDSSQAAAQNAVSNALNAIDFAMSTHRPQSELSRFNDHAAATPFALSPDTFSVLALAQKMSAYTNGAFDITVAPVVDAWGFGASRQNRIVGAAELSVLERKVGWHQLDLNHQTHSVTKAHPQIRADLSGIAKGYAVDKAAQALDELGIEHYLIDSGGEIRTKGRNAEGSPWRVAIEQPVAGPRRPRYVLPLSGLAIATSGDYRIFFERNGRRYSHEIDPASGRPIDGRLASVSVVAATGGKSVRTRKSA